MFYKLSTSAGSLGKLEPLPFLDAGPLQQRETDLESLLALNLLDVLFAEARLLGISQRAAASGLYEADLYAVNRAGDLVIFELKRGVAGEEAVLQALVDTQHAGRWVFSELQHRFDAYLDKKRQAQLDLREAHREAFQLEPPLDASSFNRRRHSYIVENAANGTTYRRDRITGRTKG